MEGRFQELSQRLICDQNTAIREGRPASEIAAAYNAIRRLCANAFCIRSLAEYELSIAANFPALKKKQPDAKRETFDADRLDMKGQIRATIEQYLQDFDNKSVWQREFIAPWTTAATPVSFNGNSYTGNYWAAVELVCDLYHTMLRVLHPELWNKFLRRETRLMFDELNTDEIVEHWPAVASAIVEKVELVAGSFRRSRLAAPDETKKVDAQTPAGNGQADSAGYELLSVLQTRFGFESRRKVEVFLKRHPEIDQKREPRRRRIHLSQFAAAFVKETPRDPNPEEIERAKPSRLLDVDDFR